MDRHLKNLLKGDIESSVNRHLNKSKRNYNKKNLFDNDRNVKHGITEAEKAIHERQHKLEPKNF